LPEVATVRLLSLKAFSLTTNSQLPSAGTAIFEAAEARDALSAAAVGGDHEAAVLSSAKCCICVPAWGLLTSRLPAALLFHYYFDWNSGCDSEPSEKIISIRHE
jgi:hypothetical protein